MTDEVGPIQLEDRKWKCCKEDIPTHQILFFTQVILIYIVVLTCIANLAYGNEPRELWISLLASGIGYILPAPSLSL
jgi:hypothetical protein